MSKNEANFQELRYNLEALLVEFRESCIETDRDIGDEVEQALMNVGIEL
jgi:hypothetical protein